MYKDVVTFKQCFGTYQMLNDHKAPERSNDRIIKGRALRIGKKPVSSLKPKKFSELSF